MITPDGWTAAHLEDLTDPARPIRYGIVQPGRFDPHGRYMIRGQDYSGSRGWAKPSEMFRVSARVETKYRNARVKAGDLIITIVGAGTGHVEVVPDWLEGANLTQTTARIAVRSDVANPWFCMYLLQSDRGRQQVANYVKGNAQPGLNIADVKKFTLVLPRREIQDEVAQRLRDVDDLLSQTERLVIKKRAIKQGLMQELLTGRTRLSDPQGEWVVQPIAALIDGLIAGTSVRSVDGRRRPAVLKTSAVRRGQFDATEIKEILPADVPRANTTPIADSIIISRMNTPLLVGDVGYVAQDQPGIFLPDRLWRARARPGSGTSMRWLAETLAHGAVAQAVRDLATGTSNSMKNIPKSRLLALQIKVPSVAEQWQIARILADADEEIAALERRLEVIRSVKQGMVQQVLTGRTRLPVGAAS